MCCLLCVVCCGVFVVCRLLFFRVVYLVCVLVSVVWWLVGDVLSVDCCSSCLLAVCGGLCVGCWLLCVVVCLVVCLHCFGA